MILRRSKPFSQICSDREVVARSGTSHHNTLTEGDENYKIAETARGNAMSKLIVMLIVAGGGGPIVVQGWNSVAACDAARVVVENFYKGRHGKTIYSNIETKCIEFANNP